MRAACLGMAYLHGISNCDSPDVLLQKQERRAKEKSLDKARRERTAEAKATGKQFYKGLMTDSDYQGEDYEVFSSWLGQTQAV